MPVQEIGQREWEDFFESFSRLHHSWLATLKVQQPSGGLSVEVHEQPFEAVHLAEEKNDRSVIIQIGENGRHALSEALRDPVSVRLRETDQGAHEAVEIDTAYGLKATLQFRTTALPQTLNGIATMEEELGNETTR